MVQITVEREPYRQQSILTSNYDGELHNFIYSFIQVHPLFHLSMADLLAAIFVIIGLGIYGKDREDSPYVCYWVTGIAVVSIVIDE